MKNNSKNITKNNIQKIYSKFGTSEKTISLFIDNILIYLKNFKKEKN